MFFSSAEQNFAEGGPQEPEMGPKQQNRARIQNCLPGRARVGDKVVGAICYKTNLLKH